MSFKEPPLAMSLIDGVKSLKQSTSNIEDDHSYNRAINDALAIIRQRYAEQIERIGAADLSDLPAWDEVSYWIEELRKVKPDHSALKAMTSYAGGAGSIGDEASGVSETVISPPAPVMGEPKPDDQVPLVRKMAEGSPAPSEISDNDFEALIDDLLLACQSPMPGSHTIKAIMRRILRPFITQPKPVSIKDVVSRMGGTGSIDYTYEEVAANVLDAARVPYVD